MDKITDAAVRAALGATVIDYRAEEDEMTVSVERAMQRHGFHHPFDPADFVTAVILAALPHLRPPVVEVYGEDALRAEWRAAGGEIHGPNVETVTMPEADYFRFRSALATTGKQQVGENPAWRDELVREAHARGLMEGLNSLRPQQVGEVQGDAWTIAELVRTDLDRQTCPDHYMRVAVESVVKHVEEWQASLAARQPVVPTPQQISDYLHGLDEIKRAVVERESTAARQPGAQEPVAFIEHFADQLSRIEMTARGLGLGVGKHAVYAAPPAQGIDLGQFRPVLEHRRDDILNAVPAFRPDGDYSEFNACIERRLAEVERLLAIVDGQRDAAPGVAAT